MVIFQKRRPRSTLKRICVSCIEYCLSCRDNRKLKLEEKMERYWSTPNRNTALSYHFQMWYFLERSQSQSQNLWPSGRNSDWRKESPKKQSVAEWFTTLSPRIGCQDSAWAQSKRSQISTIGSWRRNRSMLKQESIHLLTRKTRKSLSKKSRTSESLRIRLWLQHLLASVRGPMTRSWITQRLHQ